MNPVSVFDYFDYRAFLRDKFEESKERNPRYSIRLFNRLADARSTSFLKNVLEEDAKEGLKRRETMVTTPDSVRSLGVSNFHIAMSGLAAQAVAREAGREREFSALTIALSRSGFERAKKAIREFRKVLHSLLEQEDIEPRATVAQINLQLFKLAKTPEENAS